MILAWQLGRTDNATWPGIRKAADALVTRGPATPQERWEETGGYSNSTLPAMIAGLVTASDIARRRGDTARAALWLGVADAWQRSMEKWLFTTQGPYGDGRYYIRIDDDGDPNDGSERDFGNAAGVHREDEVVDAGFLELVRLGVKAPSDPYVASRSPRRTPRSPRTRPAGACGTATRSTGTARRPTARRGRSTRRAPRAGRGRCSAASAASTRSPTAAAGCRTCARWPTPPTTAT